MDCTRTVMLHWCRNSVYNNSAMQMLYKEIKTGLLVYTKSGVYELIGAVGHQLSVSWLLLTLGPMSPWSPCGHNS